MGTVASYWRPAFGPPSAVRGRVVICRLEPPYSFRPGPFRCPICLVCVPAILFSQIALRLLLTMIADSSRVYAHGAHVARQPHHDCLRPPGCSDQEFALSDLDADGDVYLTDFATFAANFTGGLPTTDSHGSDLRKKRRRRELGAVPMTIPRRDRWIQVETGEGGNDIFYSREIIIAGVNPHMDQLGPGCTSSCFRAFHII